MCPHCRHETVADCLTSAAIGRRTKAQTKRARHRTETLIPARGTGDVTGALPRQCLGPIDTLSSRRPAYRREESRARRRVVGNARGAQREPVRDLAQLLGRSLVRRARAVPLIQPIESPREQNETRSSRPYVARTTRRRVRIRSRGDGVRPALQSGARQQLVTGARGLIGEPRLSSQQLIDHAPPFPAGGRARREENGGRCTPRLIA